MIDTSQSVTTETNAGATLPAEGSGAPAESLNDLLQEFDQAAPRVEPAAEPQNNEDRIPDDLTTESVYREVKALRREVTKVEREKLEAAISADVDKATKSVAKALEDMPVKLSDRIIRGMLNDLASSDGRFLRAFEARHSAPDKWERALNAVAREIRKDVTSQPDKTLSEDRAAVVAAVRGATTSAPKSEMPNLHEMSDSDFEAFKKRAARGR